MRYGEEGEYSAGRSPAGGCSVDLGGHFEGRKTLRLPAANDAGGRPAEIRGLVSRHGSEAARVKAWCVSRTPALLRLFLYGRMTARISPVFQRIRENRAHLHAVAIPGIFAGGSCGMLRHADPFRWMLVQPADSLG